MLQIIPEDIFFYIIKFLYGCDKSKLMVIYHNLQKVCKDIPLIDYNWEKIYNYIVYKNQLEKVDIIVRSNFVNYKTRVKKIFPVMQILNYKGKFICPINQDVNIFYMFKSPNCITIRNFGRVLPQYNTCIINLLLTDDCKIILKCFRTIKCKITQEIVDVENWRQLIA